MQVGKQKQKHVRKHTWIKIKVIKKMQKIYKKTFKILIQLQKD